MSNSHTDSCRWIAFEIHDGLLPWVQGALMQLSELNVSPEDESRYQAAILSLREAASEGRELMAFLESLSESPEFSLADGIHRLVNRLSPLALQASQTVIIDGTVPPLPKLSMSANWAVYRIVQQAIHNAIRHAGPTEIQLALRLSGAQLIVEVIDQGCGFDTSTTPSLGHYGLTSMRERAAAIGANLEIESRPNNGTVVRLTLPY